MKRGVGRRLNPANVNFELRNERVGSSSLGPRDISLRDRRLCLASNVGIILSRVLTVRSIVLRRWDVKLREILLRRAFRCHFVFHEGDG